MNRKQLKKMRDKLAQIEERDGRLTPAAVVEEAKSPRSVLHRMFEWDDAKAAYQHRLDQARTLIASVRYSEKDDDGVMQSRPLYVRDPEADSSQQGYRSVRKLRTDRDLAHEALVGEFARAASHLHRAYEIARALNFMEKEIAEVESSVGALHTRVQTLEVEETDRS